MGGFLFSIAIVFLVGSGSNDINSIGSDPHRELGEALTYRQKGDYKKAIELNINVLTMIKGGSNKAVELSCYKELGVLYWNIGDLGNSRLFLDKAMPLAIAIKDNPSIFFVSSSIEIYKLYQEGKKFRSEGDYEVGISRFMEAIEIAKSIASPDHSIKCQRQLSLIYWDIGEYSRFFSLNEEAMSLAQKTNNVREVSNCLNNIGVYFIKLENYSRALGFCEQAVKIAKETNNLQGETDSLCNLGVIYQELGDYDRALSCLTRSLRIDEVMKDVSQISIDYINRGIVLRKRGLISNSQEDFDNALADFNSSLALIRKLGDPRLEIAALNNIGSLFFDKERYYDALGYFRRAYSLAESIRDTEKISRISNNLGIISYKMGDFDESSRYFKQAINIANRSRDKQILWEAFYESANSYYKQKKYKDALENYRNSISLIEDIRSRITLEELKASYLGTDKRIEAYQKLIDLLVMLQKIEPDKGYDKEAFNYLERGKARAFLDSLEVSEVDVSQGINPALAKREKQTIRDISKAYSKLFSASISPEDKASISDQIKSLEDQLETLKREIRMSSPAYADLKYPNVITYDDVRKKLLAPFEAYFAYSLGKEASYAFTVSQKGLKIFKLPPRNVLQQKIIEYRKAISDRQNQDFHLGRELYQELVAPGIEPGFKKIVFVPDDILNLLPFETLLTNHKPRSWLIEECQIGYAPSLSSLSVLRQRHKNESKAHKDLLAIGDTAFGTNSGGGIINADIDVLYGSGSSPGIILSPPKYSAVEIQNIARLFPQNRVTVLEKQDATERWLKSNPLTDYKIIHFATHSMVDDKRPARSAIILSFNKDQAGEGLLQARDIYNLKLNADLVTLSACQTGLGQFIRGEGIEGLSRAFFYAGSSSVLMSLWAVNDQATSLLMERFYCHLRQSESLMGALRSAKLEMIRSNTLSHPYYWAGFIISGKTESEVFTGSHIGVILLVSSLGIIMLLVLAGLAYKRKKT
jgi:CHAT domain-containing protein/tetratricopeptide (TPR) repeat protein